MNNTFCEVIGCGAQAKCVLAWRPDIYCEDHLCADCWKRLRQHDADKAACYWPLANPAAASYSRDEMLWQMLAPDISDADEGTPADAPTPASACPPLSVPHLGTGTVKEFPVPALAHASNPVVSETSCLAQTRQSLPMERPV